MSVQALSEAQLGACLAQMVSNANFRDANPHLTGAQIRDIGRGVWPATPVFSPYAATHHGYSQSKSHHHTESRQMLTSHQSDIQGSSTCCTGSRTRPTMGTWLRAWMSPMSCTWGCEQPGKGPLNTNWFTTQLTASRNVNPLHLVQESNALNQSRKACALFFGKFPTHTDYNMLIWTENCLEDWSVGLLGQP